MRFLVLALALAGSPAMANEENVHRSCLESTIWAYDLRQSIAEAGDHQFNYIGAANLEDEAVESLRRQWLALIDASESLLGALATICAGIEPTRLYQ